MPAIGELKTRTAVPLFGIGQSARFPWINTVERVNAIVEQTGDGRQAVAVLGLPGLTTVNDSYALPARGMHTRDRTREIYAVHGSELVRFYAGTSAETVASLSTYAGPVWMDDNGEELFVNDGYAPFVYRFATGAITLIEAAGYPAKARGAVYLQGRFFVHAVEGAEAGRVYASDVKNGKQWDGLNFFTPSSSPTSIVAIARAGDDLVILSRGSVEWWSGGVTSIPGALGFQPSASANTEIGGLSERGHAVVGSHLFFVGQSDGNPSIYKADGYTITAIDTPQVQQASTQVALDSAVCTSYSAFGHALFQVTVPHDDPTQAMTWIYDTATGEWSRRESAGKPYFRGLFAANTNTGSYLSDAFTGTLYRVDESSYTEAGDILPFEVSSVHLLAEGDSVVLHEVGMDVETGIGNASAPGDKPVGILSVSKDGGRTWPMVRHVTLGAAGAYKTRARAHRFGQARDHAVRFRITDPVPRRVTGAYVVAEPGYA